MRWGAVGKWGASRLQHPPHHTLIGVGGGVVGSSGGYVVVVGDD